MTTEIAIMNKSAIALAADSAATVSSPDQKPKKTYNTANKVFALSKFAPVGIMIYGNSELMGVPWETIVKCYRKKLNEDSFDTLKEYCNDFFEFLDNLELPAEAEEKYINSQIFGILHFLQDKLKCNLIKQKDEDKERIKKNLDNVVDNVHEEFIKMSKDSILNEKEREELKAEFSKRIKDVIKVILKANNPSDEVINKLLDSIIIAASIGPMGLSGVVITGFGDKDIFPSCYEYDVAAILKSKTIKKELSVNKISIDNSATILPFAQSDDVHSFLQGINPQLHRFLVDIFEEHINGALPKTLLKHLGSLLQLKEEEEEQQLEQLEEICKGVTNTMFKKLADARQKNYITPIVDATCFLSKSELANMAETLVNMVSFRKQVTMEAETVGGPIDVLVITKGDGPVWIKRKHYFSPELNHHFFSNYHK